MTPGTPGLTREALDCLLQALDSDPARAADAYERLRERLIRLFTWRRCAFPESLCDETLDRVARQLEGGLTLRESDPARYVKGVAYRVFQETVRREIRERETAQASARHPTITPEDVTKREHRLGCLDQCLEALVTADRTLLLRFYDEGAQGSRIAARKALAVSLGITRNALRIRAYRLRARIEACVRACLASQDEGM